MNGKPFKSGKFAGSFRRQLLHEHLGLLDDLGHPDPEAKIDLSDLVSDEVISYIKTTARNNTDIYDKVKLVNVHNYVLLHMLFSIEGFQSLSNGFGKNVGRSNKAESRQT